VEERVLETTKTIDDGPRLDDLIRRHGGTFLKRQPASTRLTRRASASLAGGVTSSWQITRPQVVWIDRGQGSRVWDVDGNEYVDLHGGYGVMLVGHAHPAVVDAVSERIRRGSHFAQPTEDAAVVSEELARRFGLPLWRFANSGTEATMDAVHLMRAVTGRRKILKIEGTYHGHHDSVMVSVYNDPDELGPADRPWSPQSGTGIPTEITDLTVIAPYNDLEKLESIVAAHAEELAGIIVEPIMMNAGIIRPVDGYLRGVRDLTRRRGMVLAFDEVKTGLTVAPGGATELLGVTPDIVCVGKALGGGLSCAAVGGSEDVMGRIVDGTYDQVGTFNGNPLAMAAARATLCEVLDDEAYRHIDALQRRMADGCRLLLRENGMPAHVVAVGAKGCLVFSPTEVRDFRDYLAIDDRYSHAHWLIQHNGGVFLPPWGKAEQWLLSVQHTEEDVDRFLGNLATFVSALGASGGSGGSVSSRAGAERR
jgi:glutamate-1-semialdehyde 2,1-aminomutase